MQNVESNTSPRLSKRIQTSCLCAGAKKKKSRVQKAGNSHSSIPAPLPHSTVNYSKFDNIKYSDDDEEKPPPADHTWCGPDGCNCESCQSFRGFTGDPEEESVSDEEEKVPRIALSPKQGKPEVSGGSAGSAGSQQTAAQAPKAAEKTKKAGLQAGFFAASTGSKSSSDATSRPGQKQGAPYNARPSTKPSSVLGSGLDEDDAGSLPSLVTGGTFAQELK